MRSFTPPRCATIAGVCLLLCACSAETTALPGDVPATPNSVTMQPPAAAPAIDDAPGPMAMTSPTDLAPAAPTPPPPAAVAANPDDAQFLGIPEPERGFRLATRGLEIAPGSDVEFCEVAEVPGTPGEQYNVGSLELANARGSHHLIVTMAAPDSAAERQLRTLAIGEQVPCIGAGQEFGLTGMSVLASTQSLRAKSALPDGVGQRVYGGQRLVFDYHYFNFGSEPLTAKSALAVHTLPADAPVTFVSSLAFSNMTLDVPPGTDRTFTATCTLEQDVMLAGVARHTHQLGTDFSVWFEGGAEHGAHVWTSNDWEHDTDFYFPAPRLVRAGEGFKFACGFHNPGSSALRFGIRASDEMCILGALIWSPVPQAELAPEQCVITWTDAQGIGRDADADGGFPAADPADALACHAGSLGISLVEGCVGCICDACATILARCNADVDCKALLDCTGSCMPAGSMACAEQCEPTMFEHSSAIGMITQVGECLRSGCGDACNIATPGQ
jgi:hypothetical protein